MNDLANPFDDTGSAAPGTTAPAGDVPPEGGRLGSVLRGQVLLAPLTRAGNLPFRRACVDAGARVTCSEMILAKQLVRGSRRERTLLRHHADERWFGVQLAARTPELAAEAAAIAVDAGASHVELNAGCPIDSACRKGLGAALLDKPLRLQRVLAAMRAAVDVPLWLKIRTGYSEGKENAERVAVLAEQAGVDAITVHGRTREQRYRRPADWERIAAVARAVDVPVIGNGDILHVSDARRRLRESGCTAVMLARGALVKPWFWQDWRRGEDRPRTSAERLAVYRWWVRHALEHWGDDELGFSRLRPFLELHVDFWRRYVPEDADRDGEGTMQGRTTFEPRDDMEAILKAPGEEGIARACDLILEPFSPPAAARAPSTGRRRPASGGWG